MLHTGDAFDSNEATNATIRRLFAGFHQFVAGARDTLMAGRRVRGAARRRVQAALGHAVAFSTWQSLAQDQGLSDAQAAALMAILVAAATERQPAAV